uniref:Alkyl transferase n=1 Tax=Ascaris lumbricoides TaxID=6252 RepID=A0A0M3HYF1_ASCLU
MRSEGNGWFDCAPERFWWQTPLIKLMKTAPMPKHIAFIMDGNRRYARSHCYSSVLDGHAKGFDQLTKILEWCRELCIKEVTVYAFSIENFNRAEEEVGGLMTLFENKLQRLFREKDKLIEKEISVRFFGDLSYLPTKVQKLVAQIELLTKDYKKSVINVCIAYTAQDEMKRAFTYISRGIQKGLLEENDINEYLISHCLDSRKSANPDLLIRTSGEKRLSDFLLWQCSNCYIHFDDVLWPDFDFWHLCKAVFGYQCNYSLIQILQVSSVAKLEAASGLGEFANERSRKSPVIKPSNPSPPPAVSQISTLFPKEIGELGKLPLLFLSDCFSCLSPKVQFVY